MRSFSEYIKKEQPYIIITFDPLSIYLARKVLMHTRSMILLLAWIPDALLPLTNEHQCYLFDADYHFLSSERRKNQLVKQGVSESRCYVIYIPVAASNDIIKHPMKAGLKLLYVGKIRDQDQKNLGTGFHILTRMNAPFHFDIVGTTHDEQEIGRLKAAALNLGIDKNIHWHEVQGSPWAYIKAQIKTVSALILTSTYEGFDLAIGDGLSRGIYCIGTDCEAARHDIINESNGLLYQPENSSELKECLQKLAKDDNIPAPKAIKQSIGHLETEFYFQRLNNIFIEIKRQQNK